MAVTPANVQAIRTSPPRLPTTPGVYAIVNKVTGMVYIGSSINIQQRFSGHASALRRNVHGNPRLQNSYNYHGAGAFEFRIVELLPGDSRELLLEREQQYINNYGFDGLYNVNRITTTPPASVRSDEFREKIRQAKLGKPRPAYMIEKISGKNHYSYGKSVYTEKRQLIIRWILAGASLREVARRLGPSYSTSGIRNYVNRRAADIELQGVFTIVSKQNGKMNPHTRKIIAQSKRKRG